MPLSLRFRVNEGISATEFFGNRESKVEIIVREITPSGQGQKVNFEVREEGRSSQIVLFQGEEYDMLPHSTLELPTDAYKYDNSVFLRFHAPREVEFGDKQIYAKNSTS
ncbi:hypothetical protein HY448_00620 [Candidatus Pacearchaeota archaeon]|nr:hypothetical protein [Candidatus Pacearchaeota archaeon]